MKQRKLLITCASFVLIAALTNHYIIHNPIRTVLPDGVAEHPEQIGDSIKRLSDDERHMLMLYEMRHSMVKIFGGDREPYRAVTIGEAIEEQKAFMDGDAQQKFKKQELKTEMNKEQQAKIAKVNKAITVSYLGKKLQKDRFQDFIEIRVAYQNNSSKDIAGVKGAYIFKDMFGDKLLGIRMSMDTTIKAGAKYIEEGSGLDFNRFMDSHQRFMATADDKLKFEFVPEMVIFTDGTKLELSPPAD